MQATGPMIQPLSRTNMTISGTPKVMMTTSARARLMMSRLVTDCLIFTSVTITTMTSTFPKMPTVMMTVKMSGRRMMLIETCSGW